jgi:hypothetical protein
MNELISILRIKMINPLVFRNRRFTRTESQDWLGEVPAMRTGFLHCECSAFKTVRSIRLSVQIKSCFVSHSVQSRAQLRLRTFCCLIYSQHHTEVVQRFLTFEIRSCFRLAQIQQIVTHYRYM